MDQNNNSTVASELSVTGSGFMPRFRLCYTHVLRFRYHLYAGCRRLRLSSIHSMQYPQYPVSTVSSIHSIQYPQYPVSTVSSIQYPHGLISILYPPPLIVGMSNVLSHVPNIIHCRVCGPTEKIIQKQQLQLEGRKITIERNTVALALSFQEAGARSDPGLLSHIQLQPYSYSQSHKKLMFFLHFIWIFNIKFSAG